MQGARTIGSFFASAVSKAGKTVTEAGAKIKKTVEETVIQFRNLCKLKFNTLNFFFSIHCADHPE
jgi:hypothetical protein